MFVSNAPRGARLVSLIVLLIVPGCEPEECDLDFQFSVDDTTYQLRLDDDFAQCLFSDGFGVYGQGLSYLASDGAVVDIQFPGEFAVGVFPVALNYINASGKPWYSQSGGLTEPNFASGCVATVSTFERVDWTRIDRYRIRGVIDCPLPLLETPVASEFADELIVERMTFNVYTDVLGSDI